MLRDLEDGKLYIASLYDLIDAGKIRIINPSKSLMQDSYVIAKRNGITIYDAIFVCLAIQLGLTLKTFDKIQTRVLEAERKKEKT